MAKQCPVCKRDYENEEFCPVHFVPLVSPDVSAEPAGAAEETTMDQTSPPEDLSDASLVERMKKMFKGSFKRKGEKEATAAADSPDSNASPGIVLPSELVEMGWEVSGPPVSTRGVDIWPVQRRSEDLVATGQLVVYASGVLTDGPTYQRLLGTSPARAHLHAFGTIDRGHKVRASYELSTVPGVSQALINWLLDTPASEERALSLLPGLRDLIKECAASGVLPITLDPAVVEGRQGFM